MKNIDDAYDGHNVAEMAPYAKLMGKANGRNMTRLERIDVWWSNHQKTRIVLGLAAIALMVGLALYQMYLFPPRL